MSSAPQHAHALYFFSQESKRREEEEAEAKRKAAEQEKLKGKKAIEVRGSVALLLFNKRRRA